jgi:2-C-methyl-D-erythritol 4-phosphate cytidylyltransferase
VIRSTAERSAARESGGAVPVVRLPGLLARDGRDLPPELDGVQTPQAFRAADLVAAYTAAAAEGFEGTDTAACWARYSDLPVAAVPSTPGNLKITFPEDLALALRLA